MFDELKEINIFSTVRKLYALSFSCSGSGTFVYFLAGIGQNQANLALQRAKTLLSFQFKVVYFTLMSGSSYIQGVLPGLEIGNCRRTLDVCLLFAILLGEII